MAPKGQRKKFYIPERGGHPAQNFVGTASRRADGPYEGPKARFVPSLGGARYYNPDWVHDPMFSPENMQTIFGPRTSKPRKPFIIPTNKVEMRKRDSMLDSRALRFAEEVSGVKNPNPALDRKPEAEDIDEDIKKDPNLPPSAEPAPAGPPPPMFLTLGGGSSTRTKQGMNPFSKMKIEELMAQRQGMTGRATDLIRQQGAIEAKKAMENYSAMTQSEKELEAKVAHEEMRKDEVRSMMSKVRAKVAAMDDEAEKFSGGDPDRWWNQKTGGSIGKKLLWGLMIGLSGNKDQNGNLSFGMVNNFIRQDVQQQINEFKAKRAVRGDRMNMLQFLAKQEGSIDLGVLRLYKQHSADVANHLRGIAMKHESAAVKVRAEQLANKFQMSENALAAQVEMKTADRWSKSNTWQSRQVINPLYMAQQKGTGKGDDKSGDALFAKENLGRLKQMMMDTSKSLIKAGKTAAPKWATEEGAEFGLLRRQVGIRIWRLIDQGKLSDQDVREALKDVPTGVWGLTAPSRRAAMKTLEVLERTVDSRLRASGTFVNRKKDITRAQMHAAGFYTTKK